MKLLQILDHSPSKLAPGALFLLLVALEMTSSIPSYQRTDSQTGETLTCNQCPPGMSMAQPCSKDQQTVCQPCPELHYTHYWNYLAKCLYCNVFCGENQVVKHDCNATHNRACECQSGYYLHYEFCIRHSACPPGSGVLQTGTAYEDSTCETCRPGFFSSHSSRTEPCLHHQQCSDQGMEVNVPGNKYQDTLCTRCRWYNTSSSQEDETGCEDAILEFVAHQKIPVKRLRRLQQLLENSGKRLPIGSKPAKPRKLQELLLQLRAGNRAEPVVQKLLNLLQKARMHRLEERVRKRFLKP